MAAHTFGNHCFSRRPEAASPHCHPLRVTGDKLHGQKAVREIALGALKSFAAVDASGKLEIPEFCYLSGEYMERSQVLLEVLNTVLLSVASGGAPTVETSTTNDLQTVCDPMSLNGFLKTPPHLEGCVDTGGASECLCLIAKERHSIRDTGRRTKYTPDMDATLRALMIQAIYLEIFGCSHEILRQHQASYVDQGSNWEPPSPPLFNGEIKFYPATSTVIRGVQKMLEKKEHTISSALNLLTRHRLALMRT